MVQIFSDDEQVKHFWLISHHWDFAFSCLHFYFQKIKLESQYLKHFRRVGFFSHLLKLLFLEADLVVLLVMPALPEMLGSDVLQLWTLDWRITLKIVGKKEHYIHWNNLQILDRGGHFCTLVQITFLRTDRIFHKQICQKKKEKPETHSYIKFFWNKVSHFPMKIYTKITRKLCFRKLIIWHVKQFPHQRNQSERQISVPQSKIRFSEF